MKTQYNQNKNKQKKELSKDSYYTKTPAPLAKMAYKGPAGLCLFLTSCHATLLHV